MGASQSSGKEPVNNFPQARGLFCADPSTELARERLSAAKRVKNKTEDRLSAGAGLTLKKNFPRRPRKGRPGGARFTAKSLRNKSQARTGCAHMNDLT